MPNYKINGKDKQRWRITKCYLLLRDRIQ
jgi:hypothetical protein